MVAFQSFFEILPVLAVLGAGLSGIESVPAVSASHLVQRNDHHHRHLAAKAKLSNQVGAKAKRAGSVRVVRRGTDGRQCRVRGESQTASLVTSATTAVSVVTTSSTDQTPASTESTTWAESPAAPEQPAQTSTSSEVAQPSPAAPEAPSYLGGGNNGGSKNSGSKYGFAWPNGDWWKEGQPNWIGNYVGSKGSWYYTWSPFPVGQADQLGLEFVPMLWGPNQVGDFWAQQANWPNTVKNALFFNEPDHAEQASQSPEGSVGFWMNDFVPLRSKGIALGGAGVTNAPAGLQWVKKALKACTDAGNSAYDCTPDFYPIHWYYINAGDFQHYAESFHQETGKDIWVTEYACHNFAGGAQCTDDATWSLHEAMAGWFDSKDWIKRYSPFGVMQNMQGVNQNNALMDPSGAITPLGTWYAYTS